MEDEKDGYTTIVIDFYVSFLSAMIAIITSFILLVIVAKSYINWDASYETIKIVIDLFVISIISAYISKNYSKWVKNNEMTKLLEKGVTFSHDVDGKTTIASLLFVYGICFFAPYFAYIVSFGELNAESLRIMSLFLSGIFFSGYFLLMKSRRKSFR